MIILLDSQFVFWWMLGNDRISRTAAAAIADKNNQCLVSPVSHWEMAIEMSIGRFEVDGDFESLWTELIKTFTLLPIEVRHSVRLADLPFHHRDPFDRMLIAQALAEDIPVISSDSQFDAYGVQRIW